MTFYLLPKYSNILPSKTNIDLNLTKNIFKSSFFVFCNGHSNRVKNGYCDSKEGGLGIIHRNLNIKKQSKKLKKLKIKNYLLVQQ